MASLAVLFAGQGAQYVGMGQELAAAFPEAREVMETADRVLGVGLSRMCYQGPEDELSQTVNTQPAVLAVGVAAWRVLERRGLTPAFGAGLSLGEYAALVAAGSLALEDAFRLVRKRGQYMQEAVPLGEGAMTAVLGLPEARLAELCRGVMSSGEGVVEPANFNCPGQIVISGHRRAVDEAARLALEAGAARVVPLQVSAPFHCRLMLPAAEKLRREIEATAFRDPAWPVVANVSARPARTAAEVKENLARQVDHPVRWEDSMRLLLGEDTRLFLELGPGRALAGFLRRIDRDARVASVDTPSHIQDALDSWREVC